MANPASLRTVSVHKNFASLRAKRSNVSRNSQVVRALRSSQHAQRQDKTQHLSLAGVLATVTLLAPDCSWANDDTLLPTLAEEVAASEVVAEVNALEQPVVEQVEQAPVLVAEIPATSEVAAVSDAEPVADVAAEEATEVASSETSAPADTPEPVSEEAAAAQVPTAAVEEPAKVEDATPAPAESVVPEETKALDPPTAEEVVEVVASEPIATEADSSDTKAAESAATEEAPKPAVRHVLTEQEKEAYERIEETIEKIESVIEPLEGKIESLPESGLQEQLEKQLEVMEEDLGKAEQLLDGAEDFQTVEQLTNNLFQQIKALAASVGIKL